MRWRWTLQRISVSLHDLHVSCLVPWTLLQPATPESLKVCPGLPGPRRGLKAQTWWCLSSDVWDASVCQSFYLKAAQRPTAERLLRTGCFYHPSPSSVRTKCYLCHGHTHIFFLASSPFRDLCLLHTWTNPPIQKCPCHPPAGISACWMALQLLLSRRTKHHRVLSSRRNVVRSCSRAGIWRQAAGQEPALKKNSCFRLFYLEFTFLDFSGRPASLSKTLFPRQVPHLTQFGACHVIHVTVFTALAPRRFPAPGLHRR